MNAPAYTVTLTGADMELVVGALGNLVDDCRKHRPDYSEAARHLRVFLKAVKPVRPDEPQGLGAVVRARTESGEPQLWVRASDAGWLPSRNFGAFRNHLEWHRLNDVEVLSEGVTP